MSGEQPRNDGDGEWSNLMLNAMAEAFSDGDREEAAKLIGSIDALMADRDQRHLHECLARYVDFEAFTAKKIGKEKAELMKRRRERAIKNARAAIRFFMKPDNLARLNHLATIRAASGIEGEAGDPKGLHPEGESPARSEAEGDAQ